jgi:hypothetical protein
MGVSISMPKADAARELRNVLSRPAVISPVKNGKKDAKKKRKKKRKDESPDQTRSRIQAVLNGDGVCYAIERGTAIGINDKYLISLIHDDDPLMA